MTKEQIKNWVKNYINDVKEAIEDFNEENASLFGFNDVVEVALEEKIDWDKLQSKQDWTKEELHSVYIYEAKVNWSTFGNMSIEDTKKFSEALDNAIRFAEELNTDLKNNLGDNCRNKLYKYGMRMRPAGLGCQPNGFIKILGDEHYYDVVIYNRRLTDEEIKRYEMDYLGEAGA